MRFMTRTTVPSAVVLAAVLLLLPVMPAGAAVDGIEVGTSITLYARADFVTSADGASIHFWGLTDDPGARPQYPAPTLILEQYQTVQITVQNDLAIHPDYPYSNNTSLVFPGHDVVQCNGPMGELTCEATNGNTATYTFTAENPGTYLYHSGTDAAIQVEMGLLGAIVVRPYGFSEVAPTAYGHEDTAYDREYLFLLSEMDSRIHQMVEFGESLAGSDLLGDYFSNYWFINGRTGPDTMFAAGVAWLPTQPYHILPQIHPGEKLLMRVISAGRDLHPYHHHGNHARMIAQNGRLHSSGLVEGVADLSYEVFTTQAVPGETYDLVFSWTGEKMGWDIYGDPTDPDFAHTCDDDANNETGAAVPDGYDDFTWEWCDDHGKPIPVTLPENTDLAFGAFWSGSPFMGAAGALPPGEGGLNPNSGYTFMWHSHTEKELTNNDIFPGGMLTMLIVEPSGVEINQ